MEVIKKTIWYHEKHKDMWEKWDVLKMSEKHWLIGRKDICDGKEYRTRELNIETDTWFDDIEEVRQCMAELKQKKEEYKELKNQIYERLLKYYNY